MTSGIILPIASGSFNCLYLAPFYLLGDSLLVLDCLIFKKPHRNSYRLQGFPTPHATRCAHLGGPVATGRIATSFHHGRQRYPAEGWRRGRLVQAAPEATRSVLLAAPSPPSSPGLPGRGHHRVPGPLRPKVAGRRPQARGRRRPARHEEGRAGTKRAGIQHGERTHSCRITPPQEPPATTTTCQ